MNIMGWALVALDSVVDAVERHGLGLVLGFAAGILAFNAATGWCMGDDRMVYVVKHNACVSERTFVPAGWVEAGK